MSSILPCTCFPLLPLSPPPNLPLPSPAPRCPVCRPDPSLWCQTPVREAWRDPGLHGIWAVFWPRCLEWMNALPPTKQRVVPRLLHLTVSLLPWCFLCCRWRVFPAGGEKKKEIGPFAVFRLLVVAAWLRCSAEILLLSCSLDNACRSRLAASVCLPFLYIYIYI